MLGDPAATLGGLAIVASAVAVLLLYQLGWQLYGRGVATLAALGLVVSPLFWAYGVVGLSYAAEAALATGIAVGAWAMRQGSVGALVSSAVLLGLAGGVRQSMLLVLSPLWLGMAWRGFRRPGPVLAGLGLVLLTTAAWLGPMLWLTGVDRYLAASRRALRVDGPRDHSLRGRLDLGTSAAWARHSSSGSASSCPSWRGGFGGDRSASSRAVTARSSSPSGRCRPSWSMPWCTWASAATS